MITLLSEKFDTPVEKGNSDAFRKHLQVVDWIENFLKIRDVMITSRDQYGMPVYVADEESRNLKLCRQFYGIGNALDFYNKVYEKIALDEILDYSQFEINSMFDEQTLESPIRTDGTRQVTYLHCSLKTEYTREQLRTAISQLLATQTTGQYNSLFFIIVNPLTDLAMEKGNVYTTLNTALTSEFGLSVNVMTLGSFNDKFQYYSQGYFELNTKENNVYLINKILTARRTISDMITVRQYTGRKSYIYSDDMSGKFGHFRMDLERRLGLAQKEQLPLDQSNYFDMFSIYKGSVPVYIHFVLQNVSDQSEYLLERFEPKVREFLGCDDTDPIHLIMIVNKKQTAKNMIEKIGDRPYNDNRLTVDYLLLDNLLYNPLKNVNQPKFELIKKGTPVYRKIVSHYGSTDDIPRINTRDPVNRYFGGEHNDIYQIVRPSVTKINDERDSQIHIDIAYRIVR